MKMKLKLENNLEENCEFNYAYHRGLDNFIGKHSHDFFELFLITKGEVIHIINQKREILYEGMLVLVRKDDEHYYELNNNSEIEYLNIAFSEETLKKYAILIGIFNYIDFLLKADNFKIIVDIKFLNQIILKCEHIEKYTKNKLSFRVSSLFFDILAYILENYENYSDKNLPDSITNICADLRNSHNFEKSLREIFDSHTNSYEHNCREFKKYMGVNPTTFFNENKMNYATNLLMYSDYPILNICYSCGFDNVSYFYELFKRKHRITPAKFRAKYKIVLI